MIKWYVCLALMLTWLIYDGLIQLGLSISGHRLGTTESQCLPSHPQSPRQDKHTAHYIHSSPLIASERCCQILSFANRLFLFGEGIRLRI